MIPTKYLTFREFTELYMAELSRRISNSAAHWGTPAAHDPQQLYRMLEDKVFTSIGSLELKDFDVLTHRILGADLKRQGISLSYRRLITATVKAILKYAYRLGFVSEEIADSFSARANSNSNYHVFTSQELKDLIAAAKNIYNANMYPLALFTGMRGSEIRVLFWSDLDPQKHILTISRCAGIAKGTLTECIKPQDAERRRTIRLTSQAWQILEYQYAFEFPGQSLSSENALPEQLIFHRHRNPECYLNKSDTANLLCRLKAASHVQEIGFENLRHQYAITAIRETNDLIAVKTIMGYADFSPVLDLEPFNTAIEPHIS